MKMEESNLMQNAHANRKLIIADNEDEAKEIANELFGNFLSSFTGKVTTGKFGFKFYEVILTEKNL